MAGSLGVAAAGFLPWSRTGRTRSGLELARTLREVDLAPGGAQGILVVLFLFTPLLAAAVWIAALQRRHLLVALLGSVTGGLAVTAAILLRASSLRLAEGPAAAAAAGTLAITGAAVLAFRARAEEADR